MNENTFGRRMKKIRLSKKIVLREVSENTGLRIGYLSDIEQLRISPTNEDMQKIEEFLGEKIRSDTMVSILTSDERIVQLEATVEALTKRVEQLEANPALVRNIEDLSHTVEFTEEEL